jgi:hypothetical protein
VRQGAGAKVSFENPGFGEEEAKVTLKNAIFFCKSLIMLRLGDNSGSLNADLGPFLCIFATRKYDLEEKKSR